MSLYDSGEPPVVPEGRPVPLAGQGFGMSTARMGERSDAPADPTDRIQRVVDLLPRLRGAVYDSAELSSQINAITDLIDEAREGRAIVAGLRAQVAGLLVELADADE